TWLFEEKAHPGADDLEISLPESFGPSSGKKVVVTDRAKQLVAYLISLKQPELPGSSPRFIANGNKTEKNEMKENIAPDGISLYLSTCAPCHQPGGNGIGGAFPALAGSPIVNDPNPELMIRIILEGYDARSTFGVMPGF